MEEQTQLQDQEEFYPKGALVFFLLLIILIAVIWFGMYFIMIYRH